MEVSGQFHPRAALPRERRPVPTEEEAGWATETVWTFRIQEKTLVPTEMPSTESTARSLISIPTWYPGSNLLKELFKKKKKKAHWKRLRKSNKKSGTNITAMRTLRTIYCKHKITRDIPPSDWMCFEKYTVGLYCIDLKDSLVQKSPTDCGVSLCVITCNNTYHG
jgi:hypothetical protein